MANTETTQLNNICQKMGWHPSYDVIDKCKDNDGDLWTMRVTVRGQSWTGVSCRNQKSGRLSAAQLALPVVRGWVECGGEVDVKEEKDMKMQILKTLTRTSSNTATGSGASTYLIPFLTQ